MTSYTKRRSHERPNVGLVIFAVIMAAFIVFFLYLIIRGDTVDNENGAVSDISTDAATDVSSQSSRNYITVGDADVHKGYLILVNSTHQYVFPESSNTVSVFSDKNDSYSLSSSDLQLDRDVLSVFNALTHEYSERTGFYNLLLNSAYRSYESQVETYDYFVDTIGADATALRVAVPGYSEHHTGYSFDLAVFKDGQGSNITDNEECAELIDMLPQYGFILRYPDDKSDITGIGFEPWHYRYVGTPHSLIITKTGLCFEEYIEWLEGYTADGEVLTYDGSTMGSSTLEDIPASCYGIYCVTVDGDTVVPLPLDREYEISGNNDGAVVVTVLPSK
jgi:D-alanyl-D-alanine carboxypeptidase